MCLVAHPMRPKGPKPRPLVFHQYNLISPGQKYLVRVRACTHCTHCIQDIHDPDHRLCVKVWTHLPPSLDCFHGLSISIAESAASGLGCGCESQQAEFPASSHKMCSAAELHNCKIRCKQTIFWCLFPTDGVSEFLEFRHTQTYPSEEKLRSSFSLHSETFAACSFRRARYIYFISHRLKKTRSLHCSFIFLPREKTESLCDLLQQL